MPASFEIHSQVQAFADKRDKCDLRDKRDVRDMPVKRASHWAWLDRLFPVVCVLAMIGLFVTPDVLVGQVTILAPREDTRVDFERLGLRVETYSREQLTQMNQATAISLGQSIDASVLVLTGAQMPAECFAGMFGADEVRVALDDLFRRGGMLYLGQLSGGIMNELPSSMRGYFDGHDLFLPEGTHRPTTENTIGHFIAHANASLLDLPILSQPHSLAKGDWAGVKNNIFYWRNFPDSALPILVGPDGQHPVMLLQKDILGEGMCIISQARGLTRTARSEFWENLVTLIAGRVANTPNSGATASGQTAGSIGSPLQASQAGQTDSVAQADAKPLLFLKSFDDANFTQGMAAIKNNAANAAIDAGTLFTDTRIWDAFDQVELRIYNSADTPNKRTRARLGIIGQMLIAAFDNDEPDMQSLVAKVTTPDGEAWTDDCVELVVVPDASGAVHHWIVSATGAIYDAKDGSSGWNSNAVAYTQTDDKRWRAVLMIPLTDLFDDGVVPGMFQANLAREEKTIGEVSSWVAPIHAIPTVQSVGHISRLSPREFASRLFNHATTDQAGNAANGGDGAGGFELWQVSPWQGGFSLSSKPSGDARKLVRHEAEPNAKQDASPASQTASQSLDPVTLHVPSRGNDAAVLLVRNHGSTSLVFKVESPRQLKSKTGSPVDFYQVATLYRGIPRLSSYETLGFDPLENLGNGALLNVPPGETAMLWIDVTGDAPAGDYHGEISLLPITTKQPTPVRIPLDLRIYHTQIPKTLPLNVYTWGPYMESIREKSEPLGYVDLAIDSHINTFNVIYPYAAIKPGPVVSTQAEDYLSNVAYYLEHQRDVSFVYSYHLFDKFDSALREAGFTGQTMDDTWQTLFVEWFGHWIDALQGAGVTYDDFWIQVDDEPRAHELPELTAKTALVKKHFPQARLMVTIAPWSTMEDLQAMTPHIDLWTTERRRITMRETAGQELAFYRKQDAFWSYRCAVQMDMQPLMSYYRQRGIEEYMLGVDGIALWAFNSWGGNPWAQWDKLRADGGARFDEGLVYRGEHGPIPTTRLFAFRAGIEDYVLLHLLSQANSGASKKTQQRIAALTDEAKRLLESMEPEAVEQWRRATLDFLDSQGGPTQTH